MLLPNMIVVGKTNLCKVMEALLTETVGFAPSRNSKCHKAESFFLKLNPS